MHAVALHTLQTKRAFLSSLFLLGEQKQRQQPDRGSGFEFSTQRGGRRGRVCQLSVSFAAQQMGGVEVHNVEHQGRQGLLGAKEMEVPATHCW